MKLNYLSTRAAGYLSLLRILLTPPSPSSPVSPLGGLSKVHVRASVQGRLYQRWYPAGPGLVHRLVWNKTDVYGQEVWGLTHATGKKDTAGLIHKHVPLSVLNKRKHKNIWAVLVLCWPCNCNTHGSTLAKDICSLPPPISCYLSTVPAE